MRRRRRQEGVVLVVVTFFALLLASSVAVFVRRSTLDAEIARHIDDEARAEALARAGVRIGVGLVLLDRAEEGARDFRIESLRDAWARPPDLAPLLEPDESLELRIEDAGARLNLNALFSQGKPRDAKTELLLQALFEKAIGDLPQEQASRYDPLELARNLIDWVDADDVRSDGSPESALYARSSPPRSPPNRPLLSVDELRRIEGFDGTLVDALRPYVTVFPFAGGDGINPNTAPPWVLALLYHGVAGELERADEDEVKGLLDARRQGWICANDADRPGCLAIGSLLAGEIYPPPSFTSDVFRVQARARCGDIERRITAVIDRSDPTAPRRLAWRVE